MNKNVEHILFTRHAQKRMLERYLKKVDIVTTIHKGEVIMHYYDDKPYPSALILGYIDEVPIHVVIAYDEDNKTAYVITAYRVGQDKWDPDFKTRR